MAGQSEKQESLPEFILSSKEYFTEQLEKAFGELKLNPRPLAKSYLIGLLEYFMFSHNLFLVDEETGKYKRETLAEMYLKAQNSPLSQKIDLLKRLGDSSLYISGFFGDSLQKKLVDIDYYMDMGGMAYGNLAVATADEKLSEVYQEFSTRFVEFVDVLTYISQESQVQSNEDLLRLYDRYVSTGSKLAEGQLMDKGVLNPQLGKVKGFKQ